MKRFGLLSGLFLFLTLLPMHAQMDASIKLNEVMTNNENSLIDEYGARHAWVEIANISYSTYNRSVLDKKMSVPERVKRMSQIPNGDQRTQLSGRQLIVFQLGSLPAKGALHLAVPVQATKPTWIALYNGNATQLIDSITVPVLGADQSYARIANNGTASDWEVKKAFITSRQSASRKLKSSSAKTLMVSVWPSWLWALSSSVWHCYGLSSHYLAC